MLTCFPSHTDIYRDYANLPLLSRYWLASNGTPVERWWWLVWVVDPPAQKSWWTYSLFKLTGLPPVLHGMYMPYPTLLRVLTRRALHVWSSSLSAFSDGIARLYFLCVGGGAKPRYPCLCGLGGSKIYPLITLSSAIRPLLSSDMSLVRGQDCARL